jgi:hypothetical protein
LLGIAALFALYHVSPYGFPATLCPFRAATGLLCPGCGMTRALYQLLHLHFGLALRENPFILVLPPFLYGVFAWCWNWAGIGFRFPLPRLPLWAVYALLGAWGLFAIARNLV